MTRAQPTSKPVAPSPAGVVQRCLSADCGAEYALDKVLTACPVCGELLDVDQPLEPTPDAGLESIMDAENAPKGSGVWAFSSLLKFARPEDAVTIGEGKTILQQADTLAAEIGLRAGDLHLQYEGLNPTGSFKDNGMTAASTHAVMVGARAVACASTGNTSASMAMYAARAGLDPFVFIGEGRIAFGKLSQALDSGARTLQVAGDFDACLARVREIAEDPSSGVYLMNSLNPFRLEGQKTVMLRVVRDLGWRVPDWIVVPGGNLGNCSAFGKAFLELEALGLIDRLPRLAVINAQGARTLDRLYNEIGVRFTPGPDRAGRACLSGTYDRRRVDDEYRRMDEAGERARTIASAIEINRPVNLSKALRALAHMDGGGDRAGGGDGGEGVVRSVDDECILEHKALVGRHGLGCEPASGASVAGARMLVEEGLIRPGQTVVCVLTGHLLKDPDATVGYHTGKDGSPPTGAVANPPVRVADDRDAILRAMGLA